MDLMEQVRQALGGQTPMLLPECHPLPPDAKARFAVYEQAQQQRNAEYRLLALRVAELEQSVREAKDEFFRYLHDTMPELSGKAIQLNHDGTYQVFADVKPDGV